MDLSLSEVREGIINCTACPLASTRQRAVPGFGPPDAKYFLVGEAPGYYEEKEGRPFIGVSGKYLTSLLESVHISRKEVYFANTVNCRPPENRDPTITELSACRHWVFDQLKLVDPKVVITVGRFSAKLFFPDTTITNLHGSARYDGSRIYFASYHPAAGLRSSIIKDKIEEDFRKLGSILTYCNLN